MAADRGRTDATARTSRADRGAGTVAAVGLAATVLLVAGLLAPVVASAAARHRAVAAADAAAIAAAAVVAGFEIDVVGGPCAAAAAVAAAHEADLGHCEFDGLVATVETGVGTAFGRASAWATAGPSDQR